MLNPKIPSILSYHLLSSPKETFFKKFSNFENFRQQCKYGNALENRGTVRGKSSFNNNVLSREHFQIFSITNNNENFQNLRKSGIGKI